MEKTRNDLISVVVPIYNAEKYIRRCVDSILAQSYRNLEVILVDDGSTDSTPGILDEYAVVDERVKAIHKYSQKNLAWLTKMDTVRPQAEQYLVSVGDATSFTWEQPIDAVAGETYLGPPMSAPPAEVKLKAVKQECGEIILGFLKNIAPQLKSGTPLVLAVPAWRRPNGEYARLNLLDKIEELSYNVVKDTSGFSDLLYYREGQIVAREIIVLRKK